MNMRFCLLAGEEQETIIFISKNRRAHVYIIAPFQYFSIAETVTLQGYWTLGGCPDCLIFAVVVTDTGGCYLIQKVGKKVKRS
jgi:hypothetical protein